MCLILLSNNAPQANRDRLDNACSVPQYSLVGLFSAINNFLYLVEPFIAFHVLCHIGM